MINLKINNPGKAPHGILMEVFLQAAGRRPENAGCLPAVPGYGFSGTPSFLSIATMGHVLLNPLCNRLAPTKAVKKYQ
jgi:hypothetical protein